MLPSVLTPLLARRALPAAALGLFLTSSQLSAAQGEPKLVRELVGDRGTGFSVAGAGDVDRDGFSDYVVGTAEGPGRFEVYSGRDGALLWTYSGIRERDLLGYQVSGVGDADGDGYDDIAAMAYGIFSGGQNAGEVYVISGRTGELLWSARGEGREWRWGQAMAPAGDVNNDGFDDLVVGSERADLNGPSSGAARVYSGRDGRVLAEVRGANQFTGLGSAVAGAGDLNFDGFDDLIVGASGDDIEGSGRGSVVVYSGADGSEMFRFAGKNDFDFMGTSVDGGHDANGDGVPDFVIGSSFTSELANRGGSVQVYSGADGSELWRIDGQYALNSIGDNAAFAGDMNGDGFDDVMVGDPRGGYDGDVNSDGVGYVTIYSGADGSELWRIEGRNEGDAFGHAVCAAGDVDGDGKNDIIVGAPAHLMGSTGIGIVRIFGGTRVPYRMLLLLDGKVRGGTRSQAFVLGARPNRPVQVYGSTGRAQSYVAGVGGLDLRHPELLAAARANKFGLLRLGLSVGAAYVGTCIQLQAIDLSGATSNVVFVEVE